MAPWSDTEDVTGWDSSLSSSFNASANTLVGLSFNLGLSLTFLRESSEISIGMIPYSFYSSISIAVDIKDSEFSDGFLDTLGRKSRGFFIDFEPEKIADFVGLGFFRDEEAFDTRVWFFRDGGDAINGRF